MPSSTAIFAADSSLEGFENLKYTWVVTGGTIEKGQGKAVIIVSLPADPPGETLTANLQVEGLPKDCRSETSAQAAIGYICKLPVTLDEWDKIPIREEMARLDMAFDQLRQYVNGNALFLIGIAPGEDRTSVDRRIARIRNQLIEKRGMLPERLHFVFTEKEPASTRIYLLPLKDVDPLREGNDAERSLDKLRPRSQKPPKR